MRPEVFARTLAIIGAICLVFAALIRLLSAYILTIDVRFAAHPPPPERQPLMGQYTLANFDQYITFLKGVTVPTQPADQSGAPQSGNPPANQPNEPLWIGNRYTLTVASDVVLAGAPPSNFSSPGWFEIKSNGELMIHDENIRGELQGQKFVMYKTTEYGDSLAFAVEAPDGQWILYAVRGAERPMLTDVPLIFIAKEDSFADISWDTHGLFVAYVAPRDKVDQVFLYSFEMGKTEQLTYNDSQKSNPVISPDDKQVAFLSIHHTQRSNSVFKHTPTLLTFPPQPTQGFQVEYTPDNSQPVAPEIYVVGADGRNERRLTKNDATEFNLGWTADGQVVYSVWQKDWPLVAWLYAINPQANTTNRLYPETAIDSFTCEPDLLGANKASVKITVSNTGKLVSKIPLEMAVDRVPLDVVSARSQHRVRRDDIVLQPGQSQTYNWTVDIPDDQRAYLAASVETGDEFPISAAFCHVEPRTLFMPRLRWLGWSLGLVAVGYILSIPWLRHQKNPWYWRLWGLFIVLLLALLAIEGAAVLGALG